MCDLPLAPVFDRACDWGVSSGPAQGNKTERKPGMSWAGRMCWPHRKVGQHLENPKGWALFQRAPGRQLGVPDRM